MVILIMRRGKKRWKWGRTLWWWGEGREGGKGCSGGNWLSNYISVKPEDAAPEPLSIHTTVTLTTFLSDDTSFSCDFEDGSRPTCDFVQDDAGTWQQVSAADPPTSYCPIADNTLKNSKFKGIFFLLLILINILNARPMSGITVIMFALSGVYWRQRLLLFHVTLSLSSHTLSLPLIWYR